MPERTCEWCSASYAPKRRDQRTCSADCRRRHNNAEQNAKHRAQPLPRACIGCGQPFQPTRSDATSCSARCYQQATRERKRHERVCRSCSRPFVAQRSDKLTCSDGCSNRLYRLMHPGDHRIRAAAYGKRRAGWIAQHSGRIALADWQRQVRRQEGRCYYCGDTVERMEMDHVVPLSRGGHHRIGNVVLACPRCNNRKGRRFLSEWRYRHDGRWVFGGCGQGSHTEGRIGY